MNRKRFLSIWTIIAGAACICLNACVDLDITPKNVVADDDVLSTDAGVNIYMARMYSLMPFEDFKYTAQWGFENNGWLNSAGIEGTGEAVNREGLSAAFTSERTAYWNKGFELILEANYLIENLPNFKENFSEELYNHYLGEAYYARATAFYTMAKRFGGIPLVTKVIPYPASSEEMEVPRASEEETWDQILEDFDQAVGLMMVESPIEGYSNKYVALAFKSEAMLYAGSVAKYNQDVSGRLTGLGRKT